MEKKKRQDLLVDLTRQMEHEVQEEKTLMYRRGFLRNFIAATAGGALALGALKPTSAFAACAESDTCTQCDVSQHTCSPNTCSPNQCGLNSCTDDTCGSRDTCRVNICSADNICQLNTCTTDTCYFDYCSQDDSCSSNLCTYKDVDCGWDDISCYPGGNTCSTNT